MAISTHDKLILRELGKMHFELVQYYAEETKKIKI